MPTLILQNDGEGKRKTFPLSSLDKFLIGRDPLVCQIELRNNSVSRQHAVVYGTNGKVYLKDEGSRNGTRLNGNIIGQPTALKHNDEIKICDFVFTYHEESLSPPPPPIPPDREGDTTIQSVMGKKARDEILNAPPQERLLTLFEVSNSLAKSLELEPLLPHIADTLFRAFRQADRCFIIMLNEEGKLIPKVAKSRGPGKLGNDQFSHTIVRKCLEELSSILSQQDSEKGQLSSNSISEFRIHSFMVVPLSTSDGKPLGVIQLDSQSTGTKFTEDDLKTLTIVGNMASTSIERAKLINSLVSREKERREIEIARRVQIGFLPREYPDLPGFEFFAYYSPAHSVGGDFYDFISLPGGRLAVVLGDVAGKGVAAALLMAKLSAEVRFCMLTEPDPAKAITLLNDQLIRGGIGDRFVTLACLIIDPTANIVTVVNAGHINPKRLSANGELKEMISNGDSGLPLGLVHGYPYVAKSSELEQGDTVLVYTDGVTDAECPGGTRFNEEGILKAIQVDSIQHVELRPNQVGDLVIRQVQEHANGTPQSDDIAFVCVGRVEGGPTTNTTSSPRLNVTPSSIIPLRG